MLHQEITISKFKLCTSFLIIPKMFCFFFWLWLFWERFFSLCLYYSQLIWGWLLLLIWCLMLHNHWWHHRCIFVCLSRPAGILFNGISSGQSLMNIIVSLYRSCLSSRMWFSNLLLQQVQWFKRATHKRFFFTFVITSNLSHPLQLLSVLIALLFFMLIVHSRYLSSSCFILNCIWDLATWITHLFIWLFAHMLIATVSF